MLARVPAWCYLPLLFLLYTTLAWLGSLEGEFAYRWAWVEGSNLLGIDDAYRYYLSKYAFTSGQIYAWDYVLPASTFFFGAINAFLGSEIFLARAVIVCFSLLGITCLYRAIRMMNLSLWTALGAMAIYALMPVVIIMNMSFYGEMLLLVIFSAAVFFYLRERLLLAAFLISLLPLARPEGIFLLAPFSLALLMRRQYAAFLMTGASGFCFLLFLLYYFDGDLTLLYEWRVEIRRIWSLFVMPNTYAFPLLGTFNPLWVIPAAVGLLVPGMRRYWPIWSGAFLWLLFYSTLVATGLSSYESRYLIACFPALTIGFAALVDYINNQVAKGLWAEYSRLFSVFLVVFIVGEHMLQIDPIKHRMGGERVPLQSMRVFNPEFVRLTSEDLEELSGMSRKISHLFAEHPRIDTLLVFNPDVFYSLSPYIARTDKRVFLAPLPQQVSIGVTGGSFFTYGQFGRKYAYFDLYEPKGALDGIAIYAGYLDAPETIPRYSFGDRRLFVVGYRERLEPADLIDMPVQFYQ
jgi:hypothetical protein